MSSTKAAPVTENTKAAIEQIALDLITCEICDLPPATKSLSRDIANELGAMSGCALARELTRCLQFHHPDHSHFVVYLGRSKFHGRVFRIKDGQRHKPDGVVVDPEAGQARFFRHQHKYEYAPAC